MGDDLGRSIYLQPFHPWEPLILAVPLVLLRRRGKSAGYLVCFSLFFCYMWAVCHYAVAPLPVDRELIDWMREVQTWDERVNLKLDLLPRVFELWGHYEIEGNLLLGVPFGLGFPFLAAARHRTAVRGIGLCFAFAASLELIQLAISLFIYGFPYRSIDIEDVIFVFAGALFGYAAFRLGAAVYGLLRWSGGARVPVWDHFHEVLLSVTSARGASRPGAPAREGEPGKGTGDTPMPTADA